MAATAASAQAGSLAVTVQTPKTFCWPSAPGRGAGAMYNSGIGRGSASTAT